MDDVKVTEFSNGSFIVWKNGKKHNNNGPAIVTPWSIGWYIDGNILTESEWKKATNKTEKEMKAIVKKYKEKQKELLVEYTLTKRI